MRLIEIRKDVWLEQLKDGGEYEGIEADLPEKSDILIVLLWNAEKGLPVGIFYRQNEGMVPQLVKVSLGIYSLDPAIFERYAERKTPHGTVSVILNDNTSITGKNPDMLTIYNPDVDQETKKSGVLTINTSRVEPALEMLEELIEVSSPSSICFKNLHGIDLQPLIDYVETQTEYLVESTEYVFKGHGNISG